MISLRGLILAGLLGGLPALGAGRALAESPAQEPIRIGFISSYTGPVPGSTLDMSDGFKLALKMLGNSMGGRPVVVTYGDDQAKPQIARQIADQMLANKVQIFTGENLSSTLLGIIRPVLDAGAFYVSANAGPSQLAGKGCQPHFFSFSFQNDTLYEAVGYLANEEKVPTMYLVGSNYPAGRDMLAGFKRHYKGQVVGEAYTPLDQLDYASVIADIRDKKPAGVVLFVVGNDGVNFMKQFAAAGLKDQIPSYSSAGVSDMTSIPAMGDAAIGMRAAMHWNQDLDYPASRKFAAAFEKEYGRIPSSFAAVAYDTARGIAAAVAAVHGRIEDKAAFQKALETTPWDSVRGKVTINTNHFPKQDIWEVRVVKGADGKPITRKVKKVVDQLGDGFAAECQMPAS